MRLGPMNKEHKNTIVIPVEDASRLAAIMQAANETDPKIKKIAKKLFNKIKDKNAKELAKQYISL